MSADKPRPTHTVITPSREVTERLLTALLDAREVFTVEPSTKVPGVVWHVGVFDSAISVVAATCSVTTVQHRKGQ